MLQRQMLVRHHVLAPRYVRVECMCIMVQRVVMDLVIIMVLVLFGLAQVASHARRGIMLPLQQLVNL